MSIHFIQCVRNLNTSHNKSRTWHVHCITIITPIWFLDSVNLQTILHGWLSPISDYLGDFQFVVLNLCFIHCHRSHENNLSSLIVECHKSFTCTIWTLILSNKYMGLSTMLPRMCQCGHLLCDIIFSTN